MITSKELNKINNLILSITNKEPLNGDEIEQINDYLKKCHGDTE